MPHDESLHSQRILRHNLRFFRNARGLTQADVADGIGLSLRAYQELESKKANPTLMTLDKAVKFLNVTSSDLLRINFIRLSQRESQFQKRYATKLLDFKFACLMRNFEGDVIWGNRIVARLTGVNVTAGEKVNLCSVKSTRAAEIIKAQMNAETQGIVNPYVNSSTDGEGNPIYFRVYPTLVYAKKATYPAFAATYMVPILQDTEESYFNYCRNLLECAEES